jgi:hypothetical protein
LSKGPPPNVTIEAVLGLQDDRESHAARKIRPATEMNAGIGKIARA